MLPSPHRPHLPCSRGVDLVRVEVVPDDESEIADATARLCQHVGPRGGAVFVSGGVGERAVK